MENITIMQNSKIKIFEELNYYTLLVIESSDLKINK